VPVEDGEEQRADVRAVHVRVGHDDDAVVAQRGDGERLAAHAEPERRDERLDLRVLVHAALVHLQRSGAQGGAEQRRAEQSRAERSAAQHTNRRADAAGEARA
jgi:hypothetical protein